MFLDASSDAVDSWMNLARQEEQSGRFLEAEQLYRQVLSDPPVPGEPHHAEAWHALGLIAYKTGRLQESIGLYQKALAESPGNSRYFTSLGNACFMIQAYEQAVWAYQKAEALDPNNGDAFHNHGVALMEMKKPGDALLQFLKAVEISPGVPEIFLNMANALKMLEQYEEAVAMARQALQLDSTNPESFFSLAYLYQKLSEKHREDPEKDQAFLAEAIACYQEGLALRPQDGDARYNLGNAYKYQGRLEEAMQAYRMALETNPEMALAHVNLGYVCRARMQLAEAIHHYTEAARLKPELQEAHFNLAVAYLLLGRFQEGWEAYEWRIQRKTMAEGIEKPVWAGEDLAGKTILVRAEQGYGDTFQFVRYLPELKARGATVIFECQPGLSAVLAGCPGVDRLVERGEGVQLSPALSLGEFDTHLPLLSLPKLMGTELHTIPAPLPYLHPPPDRVMAWQEKFSALPEGMKIGVVWAGSAHNREGKHRTCPFNILRCLQDPATRLMVSLQKGPEGEALSGGRYGAIGPGSGWVNLYEALSDFAETAAVIANLDLVITVDTAVAHLAGAMGKPVWVLLPYVADWRWMLDRDDSPWYPGMRLFRQREDGDWAGLMETVLDALNQR